MSVTRSESIPEVDFISHALISEALPVREEWNITEFKQKEMRGETLVEPLLQEDKTRFVLFPIKQTEVIERSL